MTVQSDNNSTQRVLLFDACNYSRLAIKDELSKFVDSVYSYAQMTTQVRRAAIPPESTTLILRLQGTLTQVMSTFKIIVDTLKISSTDISVVVFSDMPPPCARSLLVMAGLPESHFRNIWFINDKLSFNCLIKKLKNILFCQNNEPSLDDVFLKLSLRQVETLYALLKGLSPLQHSTCSNISLKNTYNHRSALLKMLSLPRLHNLYCGHYLRAHLD